MFSIRVLLFSLILGLALIGSYGCFVSAEDEKAVSAIEEAEEAVASAYGAVLEAERAGADVRELAARLNNASSLLIQARIFQDAGNLDEAFRLSNLCVEISGEVTIEAADLKELALRQAEWDLQVTIALSVFSIALIACISFFGWRAFKRRYIRRVLGMKPEVVSIEP